MVKWLNRTSGAVVASAGFAAGMSGCPDLNTPHSPTSWADKTSHSDEFQQIFGDVAFTDQYGATFKPADLFAKGPVIVMFGRHNCELCGTTESQAGISDAAATMQASLAAQGVEVPILLIDVIPDRDKKEKTDHMNACYEHGLKQFPSEHLGARVSLEEAATKPITSRLLHIAYPPDRQFAQALQSKLGLLRDGGDDYNHALDFVVFSNGARVTFPDGERELFAAPLDNAESLEAFRKRGENIAPLIKNAIGSHSLAGPQ